MGFFNRLGDAVIQKQAAFKVMYNGKEISGCSECGNNKTFPGLLPFAPTHKCVVTSTDSEQLLTILNPYSIPEECPLPRSEAQK